MEQQPQPTEGEQQRVKTLGVRIEEELHAQLSFIAQLSGNTITDEIRHSIAARVQAAQEDPEFVAKAEHVRAEIEREAHARQQAISGFFGKTAMGGEPRPSSDPPRKRAASPKAADV